VKTLAPESTWQKTNLDTCPWLQTGFFFKVKELRKNQLFFHEYWCFFEGFEIPKPVFFLILMFLSTQNQPVP
jgi:hypothetical protein